MVQNVTVTLPIQEFKNMQHKIEVLERIKQEKYTRFYEEHMGAWVYYMPISDDKLVKTCKQLSDENEALRDKIYKLKEERGRSEAGWRGTWAQLFKLQS